MLLYIVKRLLGIVAILLVMSVLIFAITQVMPGNVATLLAGQFADPATVAALEAKLGLDRPAYVQYWHWISGVLQGDLGQSLVMERPVGPLVLDAFRSSAILAIAAFVLVAVAGIGFGIVAAVKQDSAVDHGLAMVSYLGVAVPEFFWGIIGIIVFARYLDWLPSGGQGDLSQGLLSWASHLVLPVLTLTFTLVAHVSRLTRSSMIDALRSQYVRNARAKGLSERRVVYGHALPNALMPTITVLAIDVGWLLGNIVVVEAVFSYPGIGRLLLFAIERHDLPLLQAGILLIAAVYCLANLGADLLYSAVNPKIRYGTL
ncbi:MAG: ABC transporter permease [Janthinobacterium lividum]